jgi:hypothetical protein
MNKHLDISDAVVKFAQDRLDKKRRILLATNKATTTEEYMQILRKQTAKEFNDNNRT